MKNLLTLVMMLSCTLLLNAQETFVRSTLIDPPATFGSGFGATVSGVDLDGDGKLEIYSVNGMSDFFNGDEYPQIIKYEFNGTSWDSVWAASFPNERQNTWAALTTGDLDGDGKLEIIWGYVNSFSTNTTPPRIVVFENQGDDLLGVSDGAGNFTPNAQWDMDVPASTNMRPLKWEAFDIDGDGTQEIIFAERKDYYNFGIISTSDVPDDGNGSETWSMELNVNTEFYNKFVRSGIIPANGFELGGYGDILTNVDFDGDGLMDLYLCNDNTNDTPEEMNPRLYKYELVSGAWVLRWQTDIGSLIDAQNTWPSLDKADLDGDGKMEVVWHIINNLSGTSTTPARVVVFEAAGDSSDVMGVDDGSGNYLPNAYWDYDVAESSEMRPLNVEVLDFDGDGTEEIVLAERTDYYGWLVASVDNIPDNGDGSETWTLEAHGTGAAAGSSVYRDMAIIGNNIYVNSWNNNIIKVSFDGTNYTESAPQTVPFWSFKSMTTVDIDNDGTEEILAVNYSTPAKVYLLQEDVAGDSLLIVTELADLADVGISRAPGGNAGDIDGDGNVDYIMGGRNSDIIARLEYNGSGAIDDPASYTLSVLDQGISPEAGAGNFEVITFADIDSDNSDEVFYTTAYQRGLSTGAFPVVVGHYSDTLKADAGRRWDMVIANGMAHFFNSGGDIQTISYENGEWVIRPSQPGVVNGSFLSASAADIDGDGLEEVFVADWYDAKVRVLKWMNGAWVGTEAWDFADVGGNRLNGGAVGDIDGDGNIEFVTGSRQSTPNGQIYRVEFLGGDVLDPANYNGEVIDQELNTTHTQYEVINVANLDDDPELEVLYTSDYARGPATGSDPQVPLVILDVLTVQTTPIADVRVDADNDFVPDNIGQEFSIDAVVTSPRYSSSSLNYYVQDATGGIFLYQGGNDSTMLSIGQRVLVTGTVSQYNGLTELEVSNIVNLGLGTVPDPIELTVEEYLANPEAYEGSLVKFNGVTLLDGSWPSGSNANLTLWDGYHDFVARIDRDTDLDDNPEPTWPIDFVGIVGQFDTSDPRDAGYQIMFRFYSDLDQGVDVSPNPNFFFTDDIHTNVDGQITEVTDVNADYSLVWHPAVDLNGDPLLYQVIIIDENGNVTAELSDNMGADTVLTQNGQDLLNMLNGADSATFMITLNTTSQKPSEPIVASVDTIVVTIVDKYTGVREELIPKKFFVDQNYPNPFNPSTTIRFGLPNEQVVDLRIYDILGREVAVLVRNELLKAGIYQYSFNASRLASGTYIYRLTSNNKVITKKMMLVK